MSTATPNRVEIMLGVIMVTQKKQCDRLDTINKRLMAIEGSVNLCRHKTSETYIVVKRLGAYIVNVMTAIQNSFKMLCTGILKLREENSEFAGTIIDDDMGV